MPPISIINCIEAPLGMEQTAIQVRNQYADYYRKQPGYVSSTFYRSIGIDNKFNFINIVVWESVDAYQAVVNAGFANDPASNTDGVKITDQGFPDAIKVNSGQYEIIG